MGSSPGGRYESSLELPPDLATTSSDAVLSGQQAPETQEVLPAIENLQITRNDEEGWLEVNASPDVVWERLVQHWGSLGIDLVEADPKTGVMETDWVVPAEARKNDREGKVVGEVMSLIVNDIFDEATSLDKYTLQLERKGESLTRIYVSHIGRKKILTREMTKQELEQFEWVETGQQPDKIKRVLTSISYGLDSDSS